jgi:7,8-dihydro-6-hydroxymethylpterin-pyrophosphokinase
MHRVAIALGSNLSSAFGSPADNVRVAVERIGALGRVQSVSSLVGTEPEIYVAQPRFVNAARRFVLAPLAEIAPEWRHPRSGQTVGEMLAALNEGRD